MYLLPFPAVGRRQATVNIYANFIPRPSVKFSILGPIKLPYYNYTIPGKATIVPNTVQHCTVTIKL